MNQDTLSLVKMAQELCNRGFKPQEATARLLNSPIASSMFQTADQHQAHQELERRYSGRTTKPWEKQ
jgi:hypothetical protein